VTTLLLVFGALEGALTLLCLVAFVWGIVRGWELEILIPLNLWFFGTILLGVLLLVGIVIHDHVHVQFG